MTQNTPRDERTLTRRLAAVEKRLRQLETAPRAGHTSISNGKILVRDSQTGAVLATLAGADGVDPDGNPYPAGLTAGSTDFTPDVSGWHIDGAGSAEFNNVTIRGNLSLSTFYAPVTSVYDASGGGTPPWNVTSTFVVFSGTSWGPVDAVCPASGRFRVDILITGINSNTASSTLHAAIECVESSPPETGPGWTSPGTVMNPPDINNSARVMSLGAGVNNTVRSTSYLILDGLTPGNWYRFRPYWRISSGTAADITFPSLSSRFTVSPVV